MLAVEGSDLIRWGAYAAALGALTAFVLAIVRGLRLIGRWTVIAEEVLRHFTPDADGTSLPGNVALLTRSSADTAASIRLLLDKVEHLDARVGSLERWRDAAPPDGTE